MTDRTSHIDRLAHLTDAQRRAIRTVDRSILVSAAAGAGKTTVLAERCAAMVCDLPADRRCRIDELLVVTFTEAAAGEMRSRIGRAIQQRLDDRPRDHYLREQLYLLDTASISTIHAFCRSLIQRWFPQAEVDPQAAVLSGPEAALLRRETLDELFVELYGAMDDTGQAFRRLVDDYGAGNDAQIAQILLGLHDFINSLPNPQQWLDDAVTQPARMSDDLDTVQRDRLEAELTLQIEYSRHTARMVTRSWPAAAMYAGLAEQHAEQLGQWRDPLGASDDWEEIAEPIRAFSFDQVPRRPSKLSDKEKAEYDAAKKTYDEMKRRFVGRLQDDVCRFTSTEYRDGLTRITPYVQTLAQLVTEFERRYQQAKSDQAVVDFNDLQRCAFRLLTDPNDPDAPSEIARQLQRQYRYILVDEFQDVDPLQDAILHMISRESADAPEGNLFTVGDIKQSIYRFRLAEPGLFARRAARFGKGSEIGEVIHLQENFRSRRAIIDAINNIFRCLMRRDFGGSDYNTEAELHAGADYPTAGDKPVFETPAVDLHLLEPITEQTRSDTENESSTPDDDELDGIEREAYLIARQIQSWMGDHAQGEHRHIAARPASPGQPAETRPLEYRDIVILLRALPHKAEPIADVLRRMGIPARIAQENTSIDSTEFRDCVNLLRVLDNQQQDIPLAAVLRSPLMGDPLNETDLLKVRLIDRSIPFHSAVTQYAREGDDPELRNRLGITLTALNRYRARINRQPVAEVLWDIYQQTGYLAFVTGLPDGMRRREHLLQLHDLAREFGRFARQGLRRFLRFLDNIVDNGRGLPASASGDADENVVRIMTIHASKGLEFPIVILADTAKKFNLSDAAGAVLIDRERGICMSVADADRRIMYPTLLRQLAAERCRRESLSEELRILYVALTRAREHLTIVGRISPSRVAHWQAAHAAGGDRTLSRLQLETAVHPLDWLLPAVASAPTDAVQWNDQSVARALFNVATYDRSATDAWQIPSAVESSQHDTLTRLAGLEPLADDEPVDPAADSVVESLLTQYPALELTTVPARVAAGDFKRQWDSTIDPDERPAIAIAVQLPRPTFVEKETPSDHRQRGTVTHRFLQLIDLKRPCSADDLERQRQELIDTGRLAPTDGEVIMLDEVAWFFDTDLGQRIRALADRVRREIPFVARISPDRYDPLVHAHDHRDVLLVRGIVDLLIHHGTELEILDYKTDAIDPDACDARAEHHRPQLDYYSRAMADIGRWPVTRQSIVFLHPRRIVDLDVS